MLVWLLNLYIKLSLIMRHAEMIRADVIMSRLYETDNNACDELRDRQTEREKPLFLTRSLSLCANTLTFHHDRTSVLCNTVVLSSHSYMWRFKHFSPEILNKRQVMLDRCWVHSLSESGSTAVLLHRVPTDVYTLLCIKWSFRCTHRKSLMKYLNVICSCRAHWFPVFGLILVCQKHWASLQHFKTILWFPVWE